MSGKLRGILRHIAISCDLTLPSLQVRINSQSFRQTCENTSLPYVARINPFLFVRKVQTNKNLYIDKGTYL